MKSYALLFVLMFFSYSAQTQPLIFKQGVVQAPPPGAKALAAYMTIENPASTPAVIKHIKSLDFEKVEIHLSEIKDGIASMTAQNELVIPAKNTLELKQGGLHLMLINPRKAFFPGDKIELILTESNNTEHILELSIKRLKAQAEHHHH